MDGSNRGNPACNLYTDRSLHVQTDDGKEHNGASAKICGLTLPAIYADKLQISLI